MAKFTLSPELAKRIVSDTRPATRAPPGSPAPDPATPKPAKPRKPPDTSATNSLTQAIGEMLAYEGCLTWRQNTAGVYSQTLGCYRAGSTRKGLPDRLGFYLRTGHIVAVEVKTGKDKLRPDQRQFLADVRAAGGFACEGRSLEQVRVEFIQWKQSLQFKQAA